MPNPDGIWFLQIVRPHQRADIDTIFSRNAIEGFATFDGVNLLTRQLQLLPRHQRIRGLELVQIDQGFDRYFEFAGQGVNRITALDLIIVRYRRDHWLGGAFPHRRLPLHVNGGRATFARAATSQRGQQNQPTHATGYDGNLSHHLSVHANPALPLNVADEAASMPWQRAMDRTAYDGR